MLIKCLSEIIITLNYLVVFNTNSVIFHHYDFSLCTKILHGIHLLLLYLKTSTENILEVEDNAS